MAVGYIDPDGDGEQLDWTPHPAGDHYACVDDGVRQPTDPGSTDYLVADGTDILHASTLANVHQATSITIWINWKKNGISTFTCSIYVGGAWQADQSVPYTGGGAQQWNSVTFSGDWSQADIDALKIRGTVVILTNGVWVYAVYGEVTYTESTPGIGSPGIITFGL